jgi:hypothetical protein
LNALCDEFEPNFILSIAHSGLSFLDFDEEGIREEYEGENSITESR